MMSTDLLRIIDRRGQYYLMDHMAELPFMMTMFQYPAKMGKGDHPGDGLASAVRYNAAASHASLVLHHSTSLQPARFPPPTPSYGSHMDTLTSGDAAFCQLLEAFFGVCLFNICGWRLKKAMFMYGPGDTGKSVLKTFKKCTGGDSLFAAFKGQQSFDYTMATSCGCV